MPRISTPHDEYVYRHRVMSGMVVTLLVLILIVRFWPVRERTIEPYQPEQTEVSVLIDDVLVTRQQSAPPPPQRPILPQPVPSDEIIPDQIIFEEELSLDDLPLLEEGRGSGLEGEDRIVSEPQFPPSVVRIVEPSVPDLPEELKGQIEMVVNFLVDGDGYVEEASIVEIRQYQDESRSEYEVLPFIGYGLMSATLEAALSWRFRAARHDGSEVRTYTTATFNY